MTLFDAVGLLDFLVGIGLLAFFGWLWGHFAAPAIYREMGLSRPRQVMVVMERDEHIEVRDDKSAQITTKSRCIFVKKPRKADLVQYYTQSADLEQPKQPIEASDVEIVGERRVNDRVVAKYWQPAGGITLFRPFDYNSVVTTDPGLYGPDGFFTQMDVDKRTGLLTITIHSAHPISQAYLRRLPQFLTAVMLPSYSMDDKLLWEICLSPRRRPTSFEQPRLSADCQSVRWRIANPPLWSRFLFVCVYRGYEEAAESWIHLRKLSWRERVYLFMLRILPS